MWSNCNGNINSVFTKIKHSYSNSQQTHRSPISPISLCWLQQHHYLNTETCHFQWKHLLCLSQMHKPKVESLSFASWVIDKSHPELYPKGGCLLHIFWIYFLFSSFFFVILPDVVGNFEVTHFKDLAKVSITWTFSLRAHSENNWGHMILYSGILSINIIFVSKSYFICVVQWFLEIFRSKWIMFNNNKTVCYI